MSERLPRGPEGAGKATVTLLVCTKCRREPKGAEASRNAGVRLYEGLQALALPDGATLLAVECLSNCSRACSIALRGPRRWTYVYGDVDPDEHIDVVAQGLKRYLEAPDGLVPWRERPVHFRKHCIARLPPQD